MFISLHRTFSPSSVDTSSTPLGGVVRCTSFKKCPSVVPFKYLPMKLDRQIPDLTVHFIYIEVR